LQSDHSPELLNGTMDGLGCESKCLWGSYLVRRASLI